MIVSSTEPKRLLALGKSSTLPEKYGVDFLWLTSTTSSDGDNNGLQKWGVQRKEIKDLVSSAADGRLAKETSQARALTQPILVVEGQLRWGADGQLLLPGRRNVPSRFTRASWLGLLLGLQQRGFWVYQTDGIGDTAEAIVRIEAWSRKASHSSLLRRPALQSAWGSDASDKEWGMWVLQSAHGVGPDLARAVWDHFGGLPLRMTVTESELSEVKGVGPKTAKALIKAFGEPQEAQPDTGPDVGTD